MQAECTCKCWNVSGDSWKTESPTVPSLMRIFSASTAFHRLYSNQQQLTQIHIRTSHWPIMLFPWRRSKVIMRSRIQSVHQMTIIHSDIGHCWLAIIVLYLLPAPFDILYIAPVFYDGEDRRTITEGETYFRAGSLAKLPFFHFLSSPQRKLKHFILGKRMQ